jgi:ATP diphosphatase
MASMRCSPSWRGCAIRLRAAHGTFAQTFATIAPYTIEEAYEVADAIDRNDMADLRDELGDLLLQVVFHARMAQELGAFDFRDVVASISDKMRRRHPHVFGDATVADAEAQTRHWDALKRAEREASGDGDRSVLAGIARGMPEWQRALKLQQRAARVGFDWPGPEPVIAKLHEEIEEVRAEFAALATDPGDGAARDRLEDEIGDLLFVCANLARHAKVDPARHCGAPTASSSDGSGRWKHWQMPPGRVGIDAAR